MIKQFESLIFKFLWGGKPDKIKRDVLFTDKKHGGLNIPNVNYQDKSLKKTWIHRLFHSQDCSWAKLAILQLPPGGTVFLEGNINEKDITQCKLAPKNQLWKDVIISWANFNLKTPNSKAEILSQILWYMVW